VRAGARGMRVEPGKSEQARSLVPTSPGQMQQPRLQARQRNNAACMHTQGAVRQVVVVAEAAEAFSAVQRTVTWGSSAVARKEERFA